MKITVIGLGKMGLALAKQLMKQGQHINGFDLNPLIVDQLETDKCQLLPDLSVLADNADKNVVFSLLPSGEATKSTMKALKDILKQNDMVIDFSNSFYEDSLSNFDLFKANGIKYYDCGISGGVEGALNGACMMVGGPDPLDQQVDDVLASLCVDGGYRFYPEPGSGHYLKMVHNGIEYGMMQSIAEGLHLLKAQSHYKFNLDEVVGNWSKGSIIESALLDNIYDELDRDALLGNFQHKVAASGEAKWMVNEALAEEVPTPVIALSLMNRNASLHEVSFSNQVISAMRYRFGGHKEY
ncbi:NADP-dependent phosphogluconate dehydrogenase [Aerococcus viridans]|uniref:NADP-dependent phosphogluconate dehydrogenase n=1 Tax=Aerococcus viridans TaxID=1377 RepID=UPI00223B2830|nr:NADP-dependent phosphogluconate dehydrogenase [Aerococcus viridans]MCT1797275.1 NADP-dependent phosphogluconate dehydrogenase [Aerococcus viridans]